MTSTTEGETLKTPMYAAPEVHAESQRSYSADVFSLGCVFAEMATLLTHRSVRSFYDYRVQVTDEYITHAFHTTLDLVVAWLARGHPDFCSLIEPALSIDPGERPDAKTLHSKIGRLSSIGLGICNHHQRYEAEILAGKAMDSQMDSSTSGTRRRRISGSPLADAKNSLLMAINEIVTLLSAGGGSETQQEFNRIWIDVLLAMAKDFTSDDVLENSDELMFITQMHERFATTLHDCSLDPPEEEIGRKIRMIVRLSNPCTSRN